MKYSNRILARCFDLIILSLTLSSLQGCGINSARLKAEAAVEVFHARLNGADFDAIWDNADDSFHEATSRQAWGKVMAAVHRKLGSVVKANTVNWSVRNVASQTSIVLVEHTSFERGSATETFTFAARGDGVTLAGYNIQSTELVTE